MLPPSTPPTIQLLLRRCLTKDRKRRLQAIGDARVELEAAIVDPSSTSLGLAQLAVAAKSGRRYGWPIAAALAILATAATTYVATRGMLATAPKPARFVLPSKTSQYEAASNAVISPDGKKLVFSATSILDHVRRLWIRPLDEFESTPLGETSGASRYFWSDDSRSIGFSSGGKLWSIGARGGGKQLLAPTASVHGACWHGDVILLSMEKEGGLFRISASGGTPAGVTSLDSNSFEVFHAWPHFLPDGNHFLYLAVTFDPAQEARSRSLYVGSLDSDERTLVGELTSGAWYTNEGYLVYVDDGTIKAFPFDERSLKITGQPTIVSDGAFYFQPTGHTALSVSRAGSIVFEPAAAGDQLVWFDEKGARQSRVGDRNGARSFRISPSGSLVAISLTNPRTAVSDIWINGLSRDTATRLTFDARWEGRPVWSPDGSTIYFAWDRSGPPDVFSLPAQGGPAPKEIYKSPGDWFPTDVSSDGRSLLIHGPSGTETRRDMWIVPLEGDGDPYAFVATRANEFGGRFSPDAKWIAYVSGASGELQVYVVGFPEPGNRVQVSLHGGINPVWAPDGKSLFFQEWASAGRSNEIMAVDLATPEDFDNPKPRLLFDTGDSFSEFDVAPDGKRFLLRLVPEDTPPSHVILNWDAESKEQE